MNFKYLILLISVLLTRYGIAQVNPFDPCPPSNSTELCFTNDDSYTNCGDREVCVILSPKASALVNYPECTEWASIMLCITVAPSATACINVPFFGSSMTDYYDVTFRVRYPSNNLTIDFDGYNGGSNYWEQTSYGGCQSHHYTHLFTTDGINFTIQGTYLTGTGG